MKTSSARIVAWCACVAGLWLEALALLAWIDAPLTRGDVAMSAAIAGFLALLLATDKGQLAGLASTRLQHAVAFALGLAITLAFVEIDRSGTLAFAGGRPACPVFRGGFAVAFTWGAAGACLIIWPNALRAWILERLARST